MTNGETVKQKALRRLFEAGRYWHAPYEELTEAEKVLRSVTELDAEVDNGGFDQYFFNGSGDLARLAPAAFREIGAEAMAAIVERALAVFPGKGPDPDRDERIRQLKELSSGQELLLRSLDEEYYMRPDDLENLLFWYARKHADEIQGAG